VRRLLPAVLGLTVAATPAGLSVAAGSDPADPPAPTALHAPLSGHASAAGMMHDAGRARLEREHLALARRYDALTGRRTATRAGARAHTLTPPRLRAANAALRAEVRQLDVPIPPVLHRIAECESHHDPHAIGGGGSFRGLLQFTRGTWAGVGGHGDPAAAPTEEQLRRGAILLRRSGSSPWPVCGA
jgi:Transglycosylase-like domain